ncbi:amidohydrolase [Gordonia jinhuaensis]|uniref:Amidohydrolase n=1 Tax=Gordonia jinhuaensis TaxID=1517702 RepID=A0A916TAQ0_9ACTN|nr:amidohydrolase family protein [Gordonia jinhuaensis]GGB37290.1 amidohydrolase [Gordonia jinhuaensis]
MSTPDLILHAGAIHTMLAEEAPATSLAIEGDTIVAVGDRDSIDALRGASTEVTDLGSAVLTPGMVDGHIHPVMGIAMTAGVDLSNVCDLDGFMAALQAAPVVDGWIRGWGLDPNTFGTRPVTNEPIHRAVGTDIPVAIVMFDAHALLASDAALAAAGVTGPRGFAGNSEIVCDDNGRPTGHLLEMEAMTIVQAIMPPDAPGARRRRLRELFESMAAVGITSGNAMDFEDDSAELMASLDSDDELAIRVRFAPFCFPGFGRDMLEHIVEQQKLGGRRWQVDGVKFMIDGTIDGGTAWLEEADTHGESTAPFWPEPAEYRAAVSFLASHGVPTVTHAIGDAGIRYALATLESAGPSRSGAHHRIEHIETLPDDLVGEFARIGVVASMQPTHCTHYTRADQSDNWSQRLGPQRAGRAWRTRDIRDTGATLALGSDWPIAPFDPRAIMADARLRRRAGHHDESPIVPEQALTARMALEGYTSHAAAAEGVLGRAGVLAPGARADIAAFAVDPLVAPPDEVADTPVVATVMGGSFTHRLEM